MRKLAIKRLTASDLTLFEWQFRNINAGNQKAINLNRDVFIDILYPSLPEAAQEYDNRIPIDLQIFGPGLNDLHNLQRKIIKGHTYKNWRLDGEFIYNPNDAQNRYNILSPGDFVIFEFNGNIYPKSIKMILLAKSDTEDEKIFESIDNWLGLKKMAVIPTTTLENIINEASPTDEHPINQFISDADLEDVAFGGFKGTNNLLRKRKSRPISRIELQNMIKNANDIGRQGEEYLNAYFEEQIEEDKISYFHWVSDSNAIAPYDFIICTAESSEIFLDAKSTTGGFGQNLHISLNELVTMANEEKRYDLYRIYELSEDGAKLRISENIGSFGKKVLDIFNRLPNGIQPDAISVNPNILDFGDEISLNLPVELDTEESQPME